MRLCDRLRRQPIWQQATAVLFYYSMADEPDIRQLIPEALAAGKVAAFPRYSSASGHYEICQIRHPAHDLQPGQFGIHEPGPSCPALDAKRLDLVLVPGVGFSLAGGRLGRGKGHYDRLLAAVSGYKCGVAFDWQIAPEIPAEPHDISLNCILTPSLWHESGKPDAVLK